MKARSITGLGEAGRETEDQQDAHGVIRKNSDVLASSLRQYFANHAGAFRRRPDRPGSDQMADARVDAQGSVDRGEEIVFRDRIVADAVAIRVGGAVDRAA